MFKIHENGDGSTSIFCNKTGKLICTIGSQQKNMGLGGRPVNVVEPSPKPRSFCYNLALKPECLSDEDEKEESRKNCISPPLEDCEENFSDDCITQENFLRCLNLIPSKRLETESLDELKTSFPLRQLSRTKAFRTSEDLQDIKLPDDVPLTSSLAVSVLKSNEQKNFYNDQTIEMKIKHQDSFCSFQFNSPSVCSNFPKLRYREKKEYPVCVPQKVLKFSPAHIYAFNKRQRLEKMLTFKTGLSTRSRKLLLRCNKRLAVSLRRMASEEIAAWLEKKPRVITTITLDCVKDDPSSVGSDSDATVIEQSSHFCIDLDSSSSSSSNSTDLSMRDPSVVFPTKQILSFKGVLSDTNSNSFSLRSRDPKLIKRNFQKYEQCCVKVINVLKLIHKYYGDYYVKGTNIQIPFLSDYLNSLDQKHLSAIIIPDSNSTNSRYDHAYHRPFSQAVAKKKIVSNSNCLSLKSSKTKTDVKDALKVNSIKNKSALNFKLNSVESSDSLKLSVNNTVSKSNIVIDLTSDSSGPNSPVKESKSVQKVSNNVSNWKFHCYGCGYKKMFIEELAANSSANKHMKDFHCVSDPKSFLQVTRSVSGSALEAFPGYKRNWTE